jgi:folylpolyglutamate synthase
VFLEQQVDVVILEVGLGGRLDATNCVRGPVVCGVSSLGFDHMELLGHTLPEIAREKAGIFKPGVPAFSVPQREDAAEALRQKAEQAGTPLAVVRPWEGYWGAEGLELGLAGEHQKLNAALAVALAGAWEGRSPVAAALQGERARARAAAVQAGQLPAEYAAGLQAASWPGRGQVIHDSAGVDAAAAVGPAAAAANGTSSGSGGQAAGAEPAAAARAAAEGQQPLPRLSFYLDGAHTAESMVTCAHWFADATGGQPAAPGAAGAAATGAAAAAAVQQQLQQQQPAGLVTQRVLLFNCMPVSL